MSLGGPSFWLESTPDTDYPKLGDDLEVDVAVVGAGITGITAAVLLKREGKTVALIDSKRIVSGASGYTTAKVTSGHGATYTRIRTAFGVEGARSYAQANEAALDWIGKPVEANGIRCDLERRTNYVYAEAEDEVALLRQEAEVQRQAGLATRLVDETRSRSRSAPRSGSRTRRSSTRAATCSPWRRRSRATGATSSSRVASTTSGTVSRAGWSSSAASSGPATSSSPRTCRSSTAASSS